MPGNRILVIDDEKSILDALNIILGDMGYHLDVHDDPGSGLTAALEGEYDLIICDLRMPAITGADIVEKVMAAKPESRILIITAFPSDPLVSRALKAGARGVLKKPFEIAKILDVLRE